MDAQWSAGLRRGARASRWPSQVPAHSRTPLDLLLLEGSIPSLGLAVAEEGTRKTVAEGTCLRLAAGGSWQHGARVPLASAPALQQELAPPPPFKGRMLIPV